MADSKGKQSKFEMIIGAVDRFSNVFKGFNDRVAGASANMQRLQQAGESLGQATGFTRLTGAVSGVFGGMKNAVGEGKNLVATLGGMAGKLSVLLGVGSGGAMALVKGTATAASGIGDLSRQAGMGITVFQEYAHAASQAGISNEEMAGGLGHLRQMSIDAFKNDGQAQSILRFAGINPKTAKGEIKSADSLFLELADKVQKLHAAGKDLGAENLVKGFFGEDGVKFLPMLEKGAQGLLEARKEAAKYHMFSKADDENARKFNLSLDNAWKGVKGIGFSLGAPLMAPLTKLVNKFSEWSLGQKDMVAGGFGEWVEKLSDWVNKLDFCKVSESISNFFTKISAAVDWFGGWGNVLKTVAAIIAGPFLLSIGNMAMAFAKLGLAILTTPVGWFLAATAAIGAAVYAIYKNWDGIVAYFQGLWQEVKDAFDHGWTEGIIKLLWNFNPVRLVLKGMNELIAYFTGFNFLDIGSQWVDSLKTGIFGKWDEFAASMKKKVASLTDWMPDWVQKKLGFGATGTSSAVTAGAKPLNMAPAARSIAETNSRSEHVERQENVMRIELPEWATASVSGPGRGVSQHGTSWQIGQLAGYGG